MPQFGHWGEVIAEAEVERFVGRGQEIGTFRQQVSLSKPRYLIFYITGQGGAGKTTLLNRFREIATKEFNFLVTNCDERQRDVPTVLGRFAQQLAEQDCPLRNFGERYKTYRQKMQEIENDPQAPQGLTALLARTAVRAAFIGGDLIPGVRKGLELVPRETAESQFSEWATYLTQKFTNKDEVALVREPVNVLTPLFFEDLNEIAQKRKFLLCFDNFEATRPELQEWLLRIGEYKPSLNIRIAIAGRDQPGAGWDTLRNVTQTFRVDVFPEPDAEAFLNTYNITNIKRRKEILESSGRLPVLMSWLASVEGNEIESSIPTHDIVERFLRWISEPSLREVALLAAVPRIFNMDILKLLLEKRELNVDEQTAFNWLQTMPFVKQSSEGWYVHDVVRRTMLQYQRQKSPQSYQQKHATLANYYDKLRNKLGLSGAEQWANEQWRRETLVYIYHQLVADPNTYWSDVMNLFAVALGENLTFAINLIESLSLADIQDELSDEQNENLHLSNQMFQSKNLALKDHLRIVDRLVDRLENIPNLSAQAKGNALVYRAVIEIQINRKKALKDIEDALHYIPENLLIIRTRGLLHWFMGHYQKAMVDFNHAISMDENDVNTKLLRGLTYYRMGQIKEGLTYLEYAISSNEQDSEVIFMRATIYFLLDHYQEALVDLEHIIALDEENIKALAIRSTLYLLQERYQEALGDFERGTAVAQNDFLNIIKQNLTTLENKHHQEHLKEMQQILNSLDATQEDDNPSNMVSAIFYKLITKLGKNYQDKGRYEEALEMFNKAIQLDGFKAFSYISRGVVFSKMGDYENALASFDHALAIDEHNDMLLIDRSNTYLKLGRYKEALADINRAVTLNDQNAVAIARRASVYNYMGRYKEALDDINRAIELDKNNTFIHTRALTLSYLEQYAKAVEGYKQLLKSQPNDFRVLYNMAVAIARWKGISTAQFYIHKARNALNERKADTYTLYGLGGLAAVTGDFDRSLDYLQQAIQSDSTASDLARHDVAWLNLRVDPRFQAMLSRENESEDDLHN